MPRSRSLSAPFSTRSASAIVVLVVIVLSSVKLGCGNPTLPRLTMTAALAPGRRSYTTTRDAIENVLDDVSRHAQPCILYVSRLSRRTRLWRPSLACWSESIVSVTRVLDADMSLMRRRVPRYPSLAVFTAGVTGASTFSIAQVPRSSYQAAVTVLKNDVVYTVRADGTHVREETARVRVNSAQAVQSQSQTYLPFSASLQRLDVLEAHTQTADGRHIPVAPDQIITQQSPFNANAPRSDVKVTRSFFHR